MVPFLDRNWCGLSALALLALFLSFSLAEAFDNILFTNWWRQNIHLFTPLLIAPFLIASRLRRENTWILFTILILLAIHYYFLWAIYEIGKAGAAVFRLL